MSRLVDEFILMLLFTALSFLLVFYLSQNVRYGSARTYYREAVYQLQKSDYSEEAKKQCYKEAKDRGYQVQIKSKTTGYVRVILWYDVVFPFGLRKKYVIDGYEYAGWEVICVKTIVISMIGIGSILFVVMIQHTASKRMWSYERAETSLSSAMEQTMSEVMEENHYGIENRNEMLAALLQSLIAKWNHEIDLTVLVHKMDYDKRQMDVEVCGRMNMDEGKEETVSVRRKIVFEKD